MEKLPEQILGTESGEDRLDRLAKEGKEQRAEIERLEKELKRTKNSLVVMRNKEKSQRDNRQYRMFLAMFDGMANHGLFDPEELAKRGGMARVELLIKHAMGIAENGLRYYRVAKTDMTGTEEIPETEGESDPAAQE